MLGGLAMKFRWRDKRKKEGKSCDKPNIVTGPVQVCWHKFARYWDVEIREIPMEHGRYEMNAETMLAAVDENTIGVVPTLGVTFTGQYEPVAEVSAALDRLEGWREALLDAGLDPFIQYEGDFTMGSARRIAASSRKSCAAGASASPSPRFATSSAFTRTRRARWASSKC